MQGGGVLGVTTDGSAIGIGNTAPGALLGLTPTFPLAFPGFKVEATDAFNNYKLTIQGKTGGNRHTQISTAEADSRLTFIAGDANDFAPRMQIIAAGDPTINKGTAIFDYGSYLSNLPNSYFTMRWMSPNGPTEMLKITSDDVVSMAVTSGNVGIGTASPTEKLSVAGNVYIMGAGNGLIFPDGTQMTTAATGTGGGVWTQNNDEITYEGNVGINVVSPQAILEVKGAYGDQNPIPGLAFINAGDTVVTGSGTTFLLSLVEGQLITLNGEVHRIKQILSNTQFILDMPHASGSVAFDTLYTHDTADDILLVKDQFNEEKLKLDYEGNLTVQNIQITEGAGEGYVLMSNSEGEAEWKLPITPPEVADEEVFVLSSWVTSSTSGRSKICIKDSIVFCSRYISSSSRDLESVNVANPFTPVELYSTTPSSEITKMRVSQNKLYTQAYPGSFRVYQIMPDHTLTTVLNGSASLFEIYNNRIYTIHNGGLGNDFLEIKEDSANTLNTMASVLLGPYNYNVRDLYVDDGYAYIIEYVYNELKIVDVNTPSTASLISSINLGKTPLEIVVRDKWAYITTGDSTIEIYDVSIPASPILINSFHMGQGLYGALAIRNELLYVALSNGGFKILNISNPLNIHYYNEFASSWRIYEIFLEDDYVYISHGTGFSILQVETSRLVGVNSNGELYSFNPPWQKYGDQVYLSDPTDYVGIGLVNPSYPLHVSNGEATYAIYSAGNSYSTGSWVTSDKRFKKEINSLTNNLKSLYDITGSTYYLDQESYPERGFTSRKQIGLIAQEVQKVYPELVQEDHEGMLALNYDGMVPILVEAVKELDQKTERATVEVQDQNNVLQKELQQLREELGELRELVTSICTDGCQVLQGYSPNSDDNTPSYQAAQLFENRPNPFYNQTDIYYHIPEGTQAAQLLISNAQGSPLRNIPISHVGNGKVTIEGRTLTTGTYLYTLIVDGVRVETKRMVLTD